jgi:YbbR domain-containing protein
MSENMPNPEEKKPSPTEGPETNTAPTAEDLAAIKAQLDDEKKAKAAAEAALATRDARIAVLETELSEAKTNLALTTDQLTDSVKLADQAVSRYLDVVKLANPAIPGDVITGASIEEIDASLAKASSIATAVKANLEAQAKQAKVPAGAPTRGEIPLEGLSPREKIAAGILQTPIPSGQQKGGTS